MDSMMKTVGDAKLVSTQLPSSCDVRRCGQCGISVADPLAMRCPRCWAALPGMACGACRGCPMEKG